MDNEIDMSGHWFVSYGIPNVFNASLIITLNGEFEVNSIIGMLCDSLYDAMDDQLKKFVDDFGGKGKIVIFAFNRIDQPIKFN